MFHLGNRQRQCVPREEEQSMMRRGKTGCSLTLSLSPSFPVSPVLSCWPLSHAKLWLSGQGCSVVTYAPQLASSQTGDFTRHLPLPPRKGVTSPGTHGSHICSQGCLGQHQRGPEWLLVGLQAQIWHLRCPNTRFLTKPLSIEKGDSWVEFFPELDDNHWKARNREGKLHPLFLCLHQYPHVPPFSLLFHKRPALTDWPSWMTTSRGSTSTVPWEKDLKGQEDSTVLVTQKFPLFPYLAAYKPPPGE